MPTSTRAVTARQLVIQLKEALLHLKAEKKENEKLLLERGDNEREYELMRTENLALEQKLCESLNYCDDLTEQHNRLKLEVDSFRQCCDTYEQTLKRITDLEKELGEAYELISRYEQDADLRQLAEVSSLYDELIGSSSMPLSTNSSVIDLTSDTSSSNINFYTPKAQASHNNIKKRLKLARKIRKSSIMLKNNNNLRKSCLIKSSSLNCKLQLELEECNKKLAESQEAYEVNRIRLESHIIKLQDDYSHLFSKYEHQGKQNTEHILAVERLINDSRYNHELLDSLVQQCTCGQLNQPTINVSTLPALSPCVGSLPDISDCVDLSDPPSTIVFSDSIGCSMGHMLNKYLHQSCINYCLPNITHTQLIEKIKNTNFNCKCTIVLLLGDSSRIRKKEVIQLMEALTDIKVFKIILCAFPYMSCQSPSYNKNIHLINNILHNMTCRHSDKFSFFDINNFINECFLTNDSIIYLSKYYKCKIATLLANNINLWTSLHCKQNISSKMSAGLPPACNGNPIDLPADLNCKLGQRERLMN